MESMFRCHKCSPSFIRFHFLLNSQSDLISQIIFSFVTFTKLLIICIITNNQRELFPFLAYEVQKNFHKYWHFQLFVFSFFFFSFLYHVKFDQGWTWKLHISNPSYLKWDYNSKVVFVSFWSCDWDWMKVQ